MKTDTLLLLFLALIIVGAALHEYFLTLGSVDFVLAGGAALAGSGVLSILLWDRFSRAGRTNRSRLDSLRELPKALLIPGTDSVCMGYDPGLLATIYLPDAIRLRHVHILGSSGSGKSESVILNFLRQDTARGMGSVILDAKGEASFLEAMSAWIPADRLKVFDLGSCESFPYDPLLSGSPLESAQRLFASLTWSEEYYKSKAVSALQRLFQNHHETHGRNPRLIELSQYLDDPESYAAVTMSLGYPKKLAEKDFMELSGLRDQIKSLCIGHLQKILSPAPGTGMVLSEVAHGQVFYFRLQSLMSSQLVSIMGKLLINHLGYLAGTSHRVETSTGPGVRNLIPIYLDEFASFACPEFADLISKARSARFALHFSHQSVGDLVEVSEGFLNRITDNSATKIILRINDPDSAEFFARSFGTRLYQKITQRITNVKTIEDAEIVGEGTQREAHQFRASPDHFKTLPTGVGSVLIAHGYETPHGASSVFTIRFPRLSH